VVFSPGAARGGAFIKLGDIKGEATDAAHKDWIIIESFDQGILLERDAASGLPTGKRQHKPLTVTKAIDKSSPKLMEAIATGRVIPMVRLEFVTPGTRTLYYQIVLKDVIVSSYQTGGSSGGAVPMDSISLDYEEIKWTYTEFDLKGQTSRDHSYYWNLLEGIGESDELPPGSFRVSGGTGASVGGDTIKLRWSGFEEFQYQIFAATSVQGPYQFVQNYDPAADGAQELDLPRSGPRKFIQIIKVPMPIQ